MAQTSNVSGVLIITLCAFALACCILLFVNRDYAKENSELREANNALQEMNYVLESSIDSFKSVSHRDSTMAR